jgi:hypothetical protein
VYENRIVGREDVDPASIHPHPENWRRHPQFQRRAMDEVLTKIGWIQTVVINKRTGNMIDGHLRLELALQGNESKVPVSYVDLTEEEEAEALATFDPLGAIAASDAAALKALLDHVNVTTDGVRQLLTDLAGKEGVAAFVAAPSLDDLVKQFGEPQDTDFYATIRIRVSSELYQRFRSHLDSYPGDEDAQKLEAWLNACESTAAA